MSKPLARAETWWRVFELHEDRVRVRPHFRRRSGREIPLAHITAIELDTGGIFGWSGHIEFFFLGGQRAVHLQ